MTKRLEVNLPAKAFVNLRTIIDCTSYDEGKSVELALEMAYYLYRWMVTVKGARVAIPTPKDANRGFVVKMFPRPAEIAEDDIRYRSPLRVEVPKSAYQGLEILAKHFKISEENMLWGCLELMAEIVLLMRKAKTRNIVVLLPDGSRIRGDIEHPPRR